MLELKYDLHMHSCLSPCGDGDMSPQNIVNMSKLAGLDVIALTDHNSAMNCRTAVEYGEQTGLLVVPGMELTTSEEVHVVCLFEELAAAEEFSADVWDRLPAIPTNDVFGDQILVDADGKTGLKNEKLLINAVDIGVYDVVELIRSYGGFAFPAHIDRASFSLIANLGFIDPGMGFTLYEISRLASPDIYTFRHSVGLQNRQVLTNSDAHDLESILDAERSLLVEERSARGVISAIRARV